MWILTQPGDGAAGDPTAFHLPKNGTIHLVSSMILVRVVQASVPGAHEELGRITVGPWGLKLEAINDSLTIIPSHTCADSTAVAKYELKPCSRERAEILILRHGDVIQFPKHETSLTCKWNASEVQVDSSAVEPRAAERHASTGIYQDLEEEIEDKVQSSAEAPIATPIPRLSNQRSVIVQETPMAARTVVAAESSTEIESSSEESGAPAGSVSSAGVSKSVGEVMDIEIYSTAHTRESQCRETNTPEKTDRVQNFSRNAKAQPPIATRTPATSEIAGKKVLQPTKNSPRVKIPQGLLQKRNSSGKYKIEPEIQADSGRVRKRTKMHTEGHIDTQDSQMSTIDVFEPLRPKNVTAAKGIKRKLEVFEEPAETPTRSQRNSQRLSIATASNYQGPLPRVAVSNSGITKDTQAVKFLRKHGGVFIDSIKDQFNILCVRDGDLTKTPKLLTSIACGIPIVTDKWLFDSAKAGHFLATLAYIPSIPKQEKEWNIKLSQIIGHPQKPFQGYTIHFTSSLKAIYKPFTDIENVCKAAGAKKVTSTRMDKSGNIVVLAKDEQDPDMDKFMQESITCYNRDLITQSIIRGYVDLQSPEFQITPEDNNAYVSKEKKTKKQGRKSK